jgi:hypothetical protein
MVVGNGGCSDVRWRELFLCPSEKDGSPTVYTLTTINRVAPKNFDMASSSKKNLAVF